MGSSQSVSLSEAAVTLAVVAGAVGLGYKQLAPTAKANNTASASTAQSTAKKSKKSKKKPSSAASPQSSTLDAIPLTSTVVPFPTVLPGEYVGTTASENDAPDSSKRSKSKKKKGKLANSTLSNASGPATSKADSGVVSASDTPAKTKQDRQQDATPHPSSAPQAPRAVKNSIQSSTSFDTDESWTRVEPRRNRLNRSTELNTTSASEADPATTATGSSSPVAERTDDDEYLLNSRNLSEPRRPLAERLLPKPRKTGVENMLETPDYPTVARVVNVRSPSIEEPAIASGGEGDGEGDDVGWDVVKSKRPQRTNTSPSSSQVHSSAQKAPESLTKRQRQNASKRDAKKAAKAVAEEDRLATLAQHKRELERAKMAEQQRPSAGSKKVSGGMSASVDEHGKLVWE